jgi:hypothetical protein
MLQQALAAFAIHGPGFERRRDNVVNVSKLPRM